MQQNLFKNPLSVKVKASFQKQLLMTLPHLLALAVAFLLFSFSMILSMTLILFIIVSFVFYYKEHIYRSFDCSVHEVHQDSAKNWLIKTKQGDLKKVSLLDSSFSSKLLIIINYVDIDNTKYSAIFTPDSLPVDDFRHLVVRLKLT